MGGPARDELRRAATGRAGLARAANLLLDRLPVEPQMQLEVRVLGPLEVRHDSRPSEAPELGRARVRELLSVLAVEPRLGRDRAVALLWPDMGAEQGAGNLRATLAHLRRLLEPVRPAGEASFHLRTDATTIQLVASDRLTVDLWELRRLSDGAAAARGEGDTDRAIDLLASATSWWRGAPLPDLDRVEGLDGRREDVRLCQLSGLLLLGELQLTRGDPSAASSAERALAVDPWHEQAHRLAVAAAVQGRDRSRVRAVVDRATRALDELGVAPEPPTAMLLRHAAQVA